MVARIHDLDAGEKIGRRGDSGTEIRVDQHQDTTFGIGDGDIARGALGQGLQILPGPVNGIVRRYRLDRDDIVVLAPQAPHLGLIQFIHEIRRPGIAFAGRRGLIGIRRHFSVPL